MKNDSSIELQTEAGDGDSVALLICLRDEWQRELRSAFAVADWRTDVAFGAEDALLKCRDRLYNFVLIDFDGVDLFAPSLIANIRAMIPPKHDMPVVAAGGFALPAFSSLLAKAGAVEVLDGPPTTAHLIQSVASLVFPQWLKSGRIA